jgi:dsRNA-specific ribonuclease
VFTAHAIVNGKNVGAGTGRTKKAAEQVAAHVAFESLTDDA